MGVFSKKKQKNGGFSLKKIFAFFVGFLGSEISEKKPSASVQSAQPLSNLPQGISVETSV